MQAGPVSTGNLYSLRVFYLEFLKGAHISCSSLGIPEIKTSVNSFGSAKILPASSAIDEGNILVKAYEELLNVHIDMLVAVDSKDLSGTLSTCRNATDRSIRADVSALRYEFEIRNISRMIRVAGKLNLADPLTKPSSPLCNSLQILMYSSAIPMDFKDSQGFLG